MASRCRSCGRGLGVVDKLRGQDLCQTCRDEAAVRHGVAVREYQSALAGISQIPPARVIETLTKLEARALVDPADVARNRQGVIAHLVARALDDGQLTELEEVGLFKTAEALGLDAEEAVMAAAAARESELMIAKLNAGRLEPWPSPSLLVKQGEVVYLEVRAELLKEAIHRETRGPYAGVAFRIAKGVRVHTGGFRGRSVVTGTSAMVEDEGILSVTSERVVFAGSRRSIDAPFSRLLGLKGFSDGVQLQISNRAIQPTFRVLGVDHGGPLVLAYLNAAAGATSSWP